MKILVTADEKSLVKLPEKEHSLLAETYQMFAGKYGKENIIIQCPQDIESTIAEELNNPQIFSEPLKKGTAPAVGLSALRVLLNNPEETIAIAYADHPVSYKEKLLKTLDIAETFNKNLNRLILIAVNPTAPKTSYGYVEIGKVLQSINDVIAFEMAGFKEKPDAETAIELLKSWRYLWNTGYMVVKVQQFFQILAETLPELHQKLMAIKAALGTDTEEAIIETVFNSIERISIDKGVYERIARNKVAIIPVDLDIKDFTDY